MSSQLPRELQIIISEYIDETDINNISATNNFINFIQEFPVIVDRYYQSMILIKAYKELDLELMKRILFNYRGRTETICEMIKLIMSRSGETLVGTFDYELLIIFLTGSISVAEPVPMSCSSTTLNQEPCSSTVLNPELCSSTVLNPELCSTTALDSDRGIFGIIDSQPNINSDKGKKNFRKYIDQNFETIFINKFMILLYSSMCLQRWRKFKTSSNKVNNMENEYNVLPEYKLDKIKFACSYNVINLIINHGFHGFIQDIDLLANIICCLNDLRRKAKDIEVNNSDICEDNNVESIYDFDNVKSDKDSDIRNEDGNKSDCKNNRGNDRNGNDRKGDDSKDRKGDDRKGDDLKIQLEDKNTINMQNVPILINKLCNKLIPHMHKVLKTPKIKSILDGLQYQCDILDPKYFDYYQQRIIDAYKSFDCP